MSIWMMVKTFGDICLYFSVISAFPKLFSYEFSFLWPALLCAAAVGMADVMAQRRQPLLRLLCLILPGASFALAGSLMEYLILAAPAAYAAVLIIRNLNYLEYYSFRGFFKTSLVAWCIFYGVIWLLSYFEHATQPWRTLLDFRMPLLCGALYMLCGVMLLRQLRAGSGEGRSALNGAQAAVLLGTMGGALLGLVALEKLLQRYATSVLEVLKKAFLYLFTAPLTIITQSISKILPGRIEILPEPTGEPVQFTEPTPEGGIPPPVLGTVEQVAEEAVFPWWLAILILAVMVAVLALLAGMYQKRRVSAAANTVVADAAPATKERKNKKRSNRSKLRQIYRSFLKQQRGYGLKLQRHYTSEDIQHRLAGDVDPEAAALLRQLYLSARYDESREVTPQQLKAARDAMKRIRNGNDTTR